MSIVVENCVLDKKGDTVSRSVVLRGEQVIPSVISGTQIAEEGDVVITCDFVKNKTTLHKPKAGKLVPQSTKNMKTWWKSLPLKARTKLNNWLVGGILSNNVNLLVDDEFLSDKKVIIKHGLHEVFSNSLCLVLARHIGWKTDMLATPEKIIKNLPRYDIEVDACNDDGGSLVMEWARTCKRCDTHSAATTHNYIPEVVPLVLIELPGVRIHTKICIWKEDGSAEVVDLNKFRSQLLTPTGICVSIPIAITDDVIRVEVYTSRPYWEERLSRSYGLKLHTYSA